MLVSLALTSDMPWYYVAGSDLPCYCSSLPFVASIRGHTLFPFHVYTGKMSALSCLSTSIVQLSLEM